MSKRTNSSKVATPVADSGEATNVTARDAEVLALVESAVSTWSEHVSSARAVLVDMAVATYAAHAAGLVGKGQRWETLDAYGAQFPKRDGSGPVAKSTVSLWRTMGHVHSLGLTPETKPEAWGRMVQRGWSDPRVTAVLKAERPTMTKVLAALKVCYPGGTYVSASAAAKANKATSAPQTEGDGQGTATAPTQTEKGVEVPRSIPAILESLEQLATVVATGRALSPAEAEKLANVLAILDTVTVQSEKSVETAA